jgi:hypothetical protein
MCTDHFKAARIAYRFYYKMSQDKDRTKGSRKYYMRQASRLFDLVKMYQASPVNELGDGEVGYIVMPDGRFWRP